MKSENYQTEIAEQQTVLEVSELRKAFGELSVLDTITFTVTHGEDRWV